LRDICRGVNLSNGPGGMGGQSRQTTLVGPVWRPTQARPGRWLTQADSRHGPRRARLWRTWSSRWPRWPSSTIDMGLPGLTTYKWHEGPALTGDQLPRQEWSGVGRDESTQADNQDGTIQTEDQDGRTQRVTRALGFSNV